MVFIEKTGHYVCVQCGNKVELGFINFTTNELVAVSCRCPYCGYRRTALITKEGLLVRKAVAKKRLFGLLKPKIEFEYKYVAKIKDE